MEKRTALLFILVVFLVSRIIPQFAGWVETSECAPRRSLSGFGVGRINIIVLITGLVRVKHAQEGFYTIIYKIAKKYFCYMRAPLSNCFIQFFRTYTHHAQSPRRC